MVFEIKAVLPSSVAIDRNLRINWNAFLEFRHLCIIDSEGNVISIQISVMSYDKLAVSGNASVWSNARP